MQLFIDINPASCLGDQGSNYGHKDHQCDFLSRTAITPDKCQNGISSYTTTFQIAH
jgi:hypothetical protein